MPQETENKQFIFNMAATSHGLSSVCVHAVYKEILLHLLTPRSPPSSIYYLLWKVCQKSIYTKLAE